jgi:hypothetical protein
MSTVSPLDRRVRTTDAGSIVGRTGIVTCDCFVEVDQAFVNGILRSK